MNRVKEVLARAPFLLAFAGALMPMVLALLTSQHLLAPHFPSLCSWAALPSSLTLGPLPGAHS